MSDIGLETLRALRRQSDELLKWAGKDLRAFLNDDSLTFVRTSDSLRLPDDVNVTTTCSCLMALATSGQETAVYQSAGKSDNDPDYAKKKVAGAFDRLTTAQWMSSGLTENNAFTTTLVIRTLGFLLQRKLVSAELPGKANLKQWYQNLAIDSDRAFITLLQKHEGPIWEFVWRSISDKLRSKIVAFDVSVTSDAEMKKLERSASLELQRLIEGSWIYTAKRFPKANAALLEEERTAYQRAAMNYGLLVDAQTDVFKPAMYSLQEIAKKLGSSPANFIINEYDPSPAVIYWFVDGVTRAKLELEPSHWRELCVWATNQFNHQLSLVVSGNEAMMDPVSMAMAACLCARLKSQAVDAGAKQIDLQILPSQPELVHAIKELFKHQRNGIWSKYFPLFHYPEGGSNYCFTFELLEAILVEFGRADSVLLGDPQIVKGLESAVAWCKKNLLRSPQANGWNSGGSLETLEKDQPESWATAVVHIFLWELSETLSIKIQERLLQAYAARPSSSLAGFDSIIDIDIPCQPTRVTIRDIFENMVKDLPTGENAGGALRRTPLTTPHSALLFGPPGTSKTKLADAVAHKLHWPLVQIDPSHFLRQNLSQIYVEAEKIFGDLMDLSGVVVLFDEMDALVKTRDSTDKLDMVAQFLTTFMLPKLTRLHDNGRLLFLMATNFQDRFDEAIKRPGRFDVLVSVGPPTLSAKVAEFHRFVGEEKSSDITRQAAELLWKHARKTPRIEAQLQLYTFSEFKGFVKRLGKDAKSVETNLQSTSPEEFAAKVDEDSASATLRLRELQTTSKWSFKNTSLTELEQLRISRAKLEKKEIAPNQITRYLLDWKESRLQI
jgi:hypothetical protein